MKLNCNKNQDMKGECNPFFGRKHTEETKLKMSLAKRGKTPWNKGKPSPLRGKKRGPFSMETLKKMSDAKKGKKLSNETKKKMSELRKKKNNPFFGKRHTEEAKKKMRISRKKQVFTIETREKLSRSHRREKSYLWKGGITPLTRAIRRGFKYRQWRSDVFLRDDFTCSVCGVRGVYLEAHHSKISFSDIFIKNKIKTVEQADKCEEFWDTRNGITLCVDCHNKTHRRSA